MASPGKRNIIAVYIGLGAANCLVWLFAWLAFHDRPVLLGSAFLAYALGLRHALDADHIVAIDNVTRKLIHEGKRPFATGFFFSLGHSSVVILACCAIAIGTALLRQRFADLQAFAVIGTGISAGFLFSIAIANLIVFVAIGRALLSTGKEGSHLQADLDLQLSQRGFLARLFRRSFGLIHASWQMYPLGFLFGLGFDTATEIGVLALSAAGAAQGLAGWSILVFPVLFTAGMSLIDTADGHLMLKAYGWAFKHPLRRLYYNLIVTGLSVAVAFLVGGIEAAGLIGDKLALTWGILRLVAALNDHSAVLGGFIIAAFVVLWFAAIAICELHNRVSSGAPKT